MRGGLWTASRCESRGKRSTGGRRTVVDTNMKGDAWIVRYRAIGGVVFLLGCLVWGFSAFGADAPSVDNWNWMQVLDYLNIAGDAAGPTCRVWLENYTGSKFRLWKRCGVNATASGVFLRDYTFPQGGNFNWSASQCNAKGCTQHSKDGGGSLQTASTGPSTNTQFYSGAEVYVDASNIFSFGTDATIHNDYQLTCVGQVVAGGTVNATVGGAALHWASSSYLRDTSTGSNTVSSTCRNADTLIIDFGTVGSDCTMGGNVVSRIRGRAAIAGSCGCVPLKYGIDQVFPGDSCVFRPIHGDPAALGNNTMNIGEFLGSQAGKTFTNVDLGKFQSGETGVPVAGAPGGDGGIPEGYGFEGESGWTGGAGSNGTPGVSGVVGGTPAGGGSGGGDCSSPGCLDEPTPDSGVIPGVPTYDGAVESPEAADWVDAIREFIAGSPISTIITGSGVTAVSGECSVSAEIFGSTVEFGFCDIPSSVWTTWGVLILALAHLMAAYILFR